MKESYKIIITNTALFIITAGAIPLVNSYFEIPQAPLLTAIVLVSLIATLVNLSLYRKQSLRLERQMEEKKDITSKIVQSASSGIFLIDEAGIILDLNLKAESWYLESREEIIGSSLYGNVDCHLKKTKSIKTIFFNDSGNHFPAEVEVKSLDVSDKRFYCVYVEDMTETVREQDKLLRLANEDSLTELLNRRSFMVEMEKEIERSSRTGLHCSLALIDLDHFKNINDTYGHDFGDEVLRTFASILRENSRQLDVLCRYGGEEFVVLLPHTDAESSLYFLNRVKQQFADHNYSANIRPTFSCGVVSGSLNRGGDITETLLKKADLLLYKAKGNGRDRIELEKEEAVKLVIVS